MYFPFLRGKQNELLALRELLDANKLSSKIFPIIEPIKPTATFRILLSDFFEKHRSLAVIQNTELVNYVGFESTDVATIKQASNFVPAYYLRQESIPTFEHDMHAAKMGIISEQTDFNTPQVLDDKNYYTVINSQNVNISREFRHRRFGDTKAIELNDSFSKQDRNVDYLKQIEEQFSVEHLYYSEDGYFGFSDYSIVGRDFITAGFAPKAVAIHIVFFDSKDRLMVHHFVSDSNSDIHDPAKKFSEALGKLIKWLDSGKVDLQKNQSMALDIFRNLYDLGNYPGLGAIKKLSLEHHFEIMGRFLEERAR